MSCEICSLIDPNLSNVANGHYIGVSEKTIRRHKQHMLEDVDSVFGIPNAIITSRGRTLRLADGSYEKITYSPAKAAVLEAMSYDDFDQALTNYVYTPITHRPTSKTFVLCMADLQVGKAHEPRGGTPEMAVRVSESLHKAVELVKALRPQEIVIAELGDVIENFYNTSAQRQTNDRNLTEQIRIARRTILEAIMLLAPLAPKLMYLAVPSNHGSVRIGPKSPASTADDDFGIEISYQIEDALTGRPGFEHVTCVRPAPLMESLTIETSGTILGAVHGHQASAWHAIGKWWAGQSHGRRNNMQNADILLAGHWHSSTKYQSGGRWVFIGPASDGGSTWFDNQSGEGSQPGMLSFVTYDGTFEDERIL